MPAPPAPTLERKQVSLLDLAFDASTGSFAGHASVFSGVDAYGDTIVPGAYADTIPKFLSDGFIGWSHDDRIPVAYPTAAREDDHGLWIEATFHGTAAAQEARQITQERLAAGKRMGLSIGYYPVKSASGPNGTRLLQEVSLVEVSLVLLPADDAARVAEVKARDLKPFPNESACRLKDPSLFEADSFRRTTRTHEGKEYAIIMGRLKGADAMTEQSYRYPTDTWTVDAARAHCDSHDGASFEPASEGKADADPLLRAADDVLLASRDAWDEHLGRVLEALQGAYGQVEAFHLRALAQSRFAAKEGRTLSESTRQKLRQVLDARGALTAAFDVIEQLLADTEPAPPPAKGWLEWIEFRALESRLRLRGLLAAEGTDDADRS
jgi:hypothetical protein